MSVKAIWRKIVERGIADPAAPALKLSCGHTIPWTDLVVVVGPPDELLDDDCDGSALLPGQAGSKLERGGRHPCKPCYRRRQAVLLQSEDVLGSRIRAQLEMAERRINGCVQPQLFEEP